MYEDETAAETMMRQRREAWDAEVAYFQQGHRPTPETSARRVAELPRDEALLEDTVPLPRYRPERIL